MTTITSLKVNSVLESEPNLPILTSTLSNLIYSDNGSMIHSILQLSKAIKTLKAIKTIKTYQNYEKAIKTMKKLSKI